MKLLIQHNQEIAQLSLDPFPLLRAGSGDETTLLAAIMSLPRVSTMVRFSSRVLSQSDAIITWLAPLIIMIQATKSAERS